MEDHFTREARRLRLKHGPRWLVFTEHPSYPTAVKCRVGAIRVPDLEPWSETADRLSGDIGQYKEVRAKSKAEAIRTSGIKCPPLK